MWLPTYNSQITITGFGFNRAINIIVDADHQEVETLVGFALAKSPELFQAGLKSQASERLLGILIEGKFQDGGLQTTHEFVVRPSNTLYESLPRIFQTLGLGA